MTETIEARPKFLSLLLDDIKEDYEQRGLLAFVPVKALACLGVAMAAAFQMPKSYWGDATHGLDVAATVGAAILTFNALVLGLSWSAFSRIQESICARDFSSWLRKQGLLTGYFFLIDWIHGAQVLAAGISGLGLVSILYSSIPLIGHRIILSVILGASAYALLEATAAVRMMQDVIWYRSIFDEERIRSDDNVTQFRNGR